MDRVRFFGVFVFAYPDLCSTLQNHNGDGRDRVSAAKHAERQQLMAAGPPLLRHDEEHQRQRRDTEEDGDLGVRPGQFVASELERKEEEHQEGGQEEGAEEVDLTEFLAGRGVGAVGGLGALLLGLGVGQRNPAEDEGEQEEGGLADEGAVFVSSCQKMSSKNVGCPCGKKSVGRECRERDLQSPADHISQPASKGPTDTAPYHGHDVDVRSPGSDLTHGQQIGDHEGHEDIVARAHGARQDPSQNGGYHRPSGPTAICVHRWLISYYMSPSR